MAEDVVGDLADEAIAVGAGQALLALELHADVGHDPLAQDQRVGVGVEELGAQLVDHREVDAVLDLGEGVAGPGADHGAAMRPRGVMELHQRFLLSLRAARPPSAGRPA